MARRWIRAAIKRPGALRKKAGLAPGGDGKLSEGKLASLYAAAKRRGDTRTMRQINLARTLRKLRGRKRSRSKAAA